jgi:hypothetical protein
MKIRHGIFTWLKTLVIGTVILAGTLSVFGKLFNVSFFVLDIELLAVVTIVAALCSIPTILSLFAVNIFNHIKIKSVSEARRNQNYTHLVCSIVTFLVIATSENFDFSNLSSYFKEDALFIEACFVSYAPLGIYLWDRALVKNYTNVNLKKEIETDLYHTEK